MPNSKGELPPVCHLSTEMISQNARNVKGQFNPPQVHSLAAHRLYKDFVYPPFEGKYSSPTAFVLALREQECVKFTTSPALLIVLYSGRLGLRGASIMMFREAKEMESLERDSSNANVCVDFGASATLDASPACDSYEHLADAIHGLSAVANNARYDHCRKVISRLRLFVARNWSADPAEIPLRIHLTRLYVDRFLGRATGYIQHKGDSWWPAFCDAVKCIDYANPDRTMSLVNALQTREPEVCHLDRPSRDPTAHKRPSGMPEEIKILVPVNRAGEEPCLRHFSGIGCPGGREPCTIRKLHRWATKHPSPLLDWARNNMRRPGLNDHYERS